MTIDKFGQHLHKRRALEIPTYNVTLSFTAYEIIKTKKGSLQINYFYLNHALTDYIIKYNYAVIKEIEVHKSLYNKQTFTTERNPTTIKMHINDKAYELNQVVGLTLSKGDIIQFSTTQWSSVHQGFMVDLLLECRQNV